MTDMRSQYCYNSNAPMRVRPHDNAIRALSVALVVFAIVATVGEAPSTPRAQAASEPHFKDDSDWWSFYSSASLPEDLAPQERALTPDNLTVLGISLAEPWGDGQIEARLGKAQWFNRGQANRERGQTCYVSAVNGFPAYLIFEGSIESDSSFYFFKGGKSWTGEDLCVRSPAVTAAMGTAQEFIWARIWTE